MASNIDIVRLSLSTNGNVTSDRSIRGRVKKIYVEYEASSNAATDVTIDHLHDAVTENLLTLTDTNTSGVFYPKTPSQDVTGTDVTFDATNEIYESFLVDGKIKLTMGSNTALKSIVVKVYVETF